MEWSNHQDWNILQDEQLNKMGFVRTTADLCVYTAATGEMFIIAVYVDDILLAGRNDKCMIEVKKMLVKHFEIKDMCKMTHFIWVKIVQDGSDNMCQKCVGKIQNGLLALFMLWTVILC